MAKTMYQATGRRKSSVARVRLLPGAGNIIINKRDLDTYFGEKDVVKNEVRRPLELTGTLGSFDVIATVNGGGFTGQAGALRHGIARALCEVDEEAYRPALKAAGFLTRDPRMKERKKPGLKKARRASQFSPLHLKRMEASLLAGAEVQTAQARFTQAVLSRLQMM